jgi:hypothetical protein
MTSSSDLEALRQRIFATAEDPAETPADFNQVAVEARRAIETGVLARRPSSLRVRLFGLGVPGHEVPVHRAASILDALQGAVTATGEAVRKQGALGASSGDSQRTTADATELFLSPRIESGSVVFFLEAKERSSTDPPAVREDVEGLIDVAVRRLFDLIELASEELDNRESLEEAMRDLGSRAASKVAGLAKASAEQEVELDLALRTPRGKRASGVLSHRTSVALQNAYARASDRVERHQFVGVLKTVSDGSDPLRMDVEGMPRDIRLRVESVLGAQLGPLLGRRIRADVEVTIKWQPASGRETRSYQLLEAVELPTSQMTLSRTSQSERDQWS